MKLCSQDEHYIYTRDFPYIKVPKIPPMHQSLKNPQQGPQSAPLHQSVYHQSALLDHNPQNVTLYQYPQNHQIPQHSLYTLEAKLTSEPLECALTSVPPDCPLTAVTSECPLT